MFFRRAAVAIPAFTLIVAAPASAATTAAAGPSPTPLILEVALAVVVAGALALRGPAARLAGAIRRLARVPRTAVARTRARV